MKWTLQVAPEDCTGLCLCIRSLPGQNKTGGQAQGDQHGSAAAHSLDRAARTQLLPWSCRSFDRRKVKVGQLASSR